MAFAVDEDVASIGPDAVFVEVGGNAVVVLWNNVEHILAAALVVYYCCVDNLVVVFALVITGVDTVGHVNIWYCGAGVGLDAKCIQHMHFADRCLAVALALLANAVFANIDAGGEQHLAVYSQSGRGFTAMHVVYFQQLSVLVGIAAT